MRREALRCGEKIDSVKPIVEHELQLPEGGPRSDGELQAAIVAFVSLAVGARIDMLTSAMRAIQSIGNALFGKIFKVSIFNGELLIKLIY